MPSSLDTSCPRCLSIVDFDIFANGVYISLWLATEAFFDAIFNTTLSGCNSSINYKFHYPPSPSPPPSLYTSNIEAKAPVSPPNPCIRSVYSSFYGYPRVSMSIRRLLFAAATVQTTKSLYTSRSALTSAVFRGPVHVLRNRTAGFSTGFLGDWQLQKIVAVGSRKTAAGGSSRSSGRGRKNF